MDARCISNYTKDIIINYENIKTNYTRKTSYK